MSSISCWKVLTRRKGLPSTSSSASSPGSVNGNSSQNLGRILNTFDLTALGVGATLGVGVYVLAGHVSRDLAGPSVVLSFLIAAVASFMAGLCYGELGARVPKAGSAYYYSYVCIGEIVAFITGWNLILQYVIGSASISRGLSLYLDTIFNDTIKETFREIAPINTPAFSRYFDFLAFGLPILLAAALAFGLKKSAIMNNIFTLINIGIVLFVIICGAFKADIANWQILPSNDNSTAQAIGDGGFFPFGIEGMIKGAATCFFGFVGFDCIATTGEEVKNPKSAIPKAILFSLITIFLSYFGVSTVLTLMWPYYLQDINAPLPYAFDQIGMNVAKWIVSVGGIVGLVTSLFGAMFPLPRIVYAMSQDGLIFKFLGRVNETFKTPVIGTMLAGVLTGLVAAIFDLKQLVNMLSIGTLLAYTVVAISITILRYSDRHGTYTEVGSDDNMVKPKSSGVIDRFFGGQKQRKPSKTSAKTVIVAIFVFSILSLALGLFILHTKTYLITGEIWAIVCWSLVFALMLVMLIVISVQPQEASPGNIFRVPLVPLIPGISIFVNIYLMLMLDMYTWIFFAVWLVIGLTIYNLCTFVLVEPGVRNNSIVDPRHSVESRSGGTDSKDDKDKTLKSVSSFNSDKSKEKFKETLETAVVTKSDSFGDFQRDFNEILTEDELKDTLEKKIQPNGAATFIERKDSTENALEILDNVIQNEIQESARRYSLTPVENEVIVLEPEKDPTDIEFETIVTVHREIGSPLQEENPLTSLESVKQMTQQEDSDSGILMNSHNSLNEAKPSELEIELGLEETINESELNEIVKPILLVDEAEMVYPKMNIVNGTKTLPLRKDMEDDSKHHVKGSKSETDLRTLLFAEIKSFKKPENISVPQNEEDAFHDIHPPIKSPIQAISPITIPEPPKFDPVKFENTNTFPRPQLKIVPLKKKSPAPSPPVQKSSKTEQPEEDTSPDILTPHSSNFSSFKNKLEAIYSRGPPSPFTLFNKPPKTKPEVNTEATPVDETPKETENDSEEKTQNYKLNTMKPFDTVHKQKVLFNDVIKSINPDTRPSVIKKESFNQNNPK